MSPTRFLCASEHLPQDCSNVCEKITNVESTAETQFPLPLHGRPRCAARSGDTGEGKEGRRRADPDADGGYYTGPARPVGRPPEPGHVESGATAATATSTSAAAATATSTSTRWMAVPRPRS